MLETAGITFYLYEKHFVSLNNLAILDREDFFLRNYVYARNNIYKFSTASIPAHWQSCRLQQGSCEVKRLRLQLLPRLSSRVLCDVGFFPFPKPPRHRKRPATNQREGPRHPLANEGRGLRINA